MIGFDTHTVDSPPVGYYRAEGMIKNVNTIEEYRNMDKSQMILQAGKTVRSTLGRLLGDIDKCSRSGMPSTMALSTHAPPCCRLLLFSHSQTSKSTSFTIGLPSPLYTVIRRGLPWTRHHPNPNPTRVP